MIAGQLELQMFANMARLSDDMTQAKKIAGDAMGQIEKSAAGARRMLEAVGLGFSVASLAGMIKGSIEAADRLNDLSKITNLLPSQLAGLALAGEQSGTSLEGAANAVSKLAENMGKDSLKFAQIGVTAKDPIEAFKQLADVFNSIEDPQQRAAFGAAALGKSWKEVAPLLAEGGDNIGKMVEQGTSLAGNIDGLAAASDEFNDKLAVLQATLSGTFNKAVIELLPIFSKLIDYMQQSSEGASGVDVVFEALVEVIRVLVVIGANVVYVFKSIGIEIGGIAAQMVALASGDFEGFSAIGKAMKEDAAIARKEIDAFSESIMKAAPAVTAASKEAIKSVKPADQATIQQFINQGGDSGAQKGTGIVNSLLTDYANQIAKLNRELNAPMMSAVDKQYADNLAVVTERAAKAEEAIGKLKISETERAKLLGQVGIAEEAQIARLQELKKQIEANNASWQYGAKVALRAYLDEVENVAKQSQNLFTNAFKGMEDALVKFVQTGKLDFRSLADSIIADMIRMQVQQNVTGPLARWLAGMAGAGSTGTPGYGDTAGVAAGVPSYAGGGDTGSASRSGGVDGMGGFFAVMHPQETVIDHTLPSPSGSNNNQSARPINMTFHFAVPAPTDRRTQMQIAAMAGASVNRALARNG
jgi:lambda family phage tail tape measure protein